MMHYLNDTIYLLLETEKIFSESINQMKLYESDDKIIFLEKSYEMLKDFLNILMEDNISFYHEIVDLENSDKNLFITNNTFYFKAFLIKVLKLHILLIF